MSRRISAAVVATVVLTFVPGAAYGSQADADAHPTDHPSASRSAAGAARWHLSGRWRGKQHDSLGGTVKMRMKLHRTKAGGVRGKAVYRHGTPCRSTLRRVKTTKSRWQVFREHVWYDPADYCSGGRVRMHRWTKGRLKVMWPKGTIEERATLHRP